MEQWYLPIYILPGIGLLIMSTALLQGSLSTELSALLKEEVEFMKDIIERKINQVGLLNKALVGFYISAACFVLAGLFNGLAFFSNLMISIVDNILLFIGVLSCLISLIFLSIFSTRAVRIKREQFKKKLDYNKNK